MYPGEQGTAVIYASDDASGIKGYGIAAQLHEIAGIFAYRKGLLININYHFISCLACACGCLASTCGSLA